MVAAFFAGVIVGGLLAIGVAFKLACWASEKVDDEEMQADVVLWI